GLIKLKSVIVPALKKHSASLIFLHGSGDSGNGVKEWLDSLLNREFAFQHIKLIFPTAPERLFYTPFQETMRVWFDREKISPLGKENYDLIDSMACNIKDIIQEEIDSGISINRIIIGGGFSMGGAMAFHVGYRFCQDLAGVFSISAFLNDDSEVYKAVKTSSKRMPPLYQAHGSKDELVLLLWGKNTNAELSKLGVDTKMNVYQNLAHQMNRKEIQDLSEWIYNVIPPE
ncbi:hypothetical protein HELRODRAFT_75154, partial [Helobdella robusta]|uniref:palmitoyl-protein hydrolase n=1 Tax=Helobdella robusta TaxID=6412 RepID=T1G216_HELRO